MNTVACEAATRLNTQAGHGSRHHRRQQAQAPAQVIRHRGQPDPQSRFGKAQPAHPAQAIATLAGAEHFLDPEADAPDIGVVRLQLLQRFRPASGAGVHDTGNAATSADDPF